MRIDTELRKTLTVGRPISVRKAEYTQLSEDA
jgi:hypothetical protein